jgi:signal transduction histidine kinase
MRFFRDISIRYKITLLLLMVVSIVLLAVSIANVIGEVRSTRGSLVTKYSTLAKIVAAQSGAALSIADIDPSTAQEILDDLAIEPSIVYAALIGLNGHEVVHYPSDSSDGSAPHDVEDLGARFTEDGFLDVMQEVRLNNASLVGHIYLRASTEELRVQVYQTILIASVVYILALAIALLLSFTLQRLISTPVLQLAELTRQVSTEHNYTLSAEHQGNDELGVLCQGFNSMLSEIRRRDDELMRSNDELRQFAFVASHDLQEPLRSVTSFCNMLQAECQDKLTPDANGYLDRIVNGATRMKALVTDLLNYSRVSREEQVDFERVELRNVIGEAIVNLQSSIESSGAEIFCGELPRVQGDRSQLVQVIQNLLGNAMIYRGPRPPQIHIEVTKKHKYVEIAVRDNGIGIAPEHYERIFEIFKRLHNRSKYPGTGIGLAVCRKIVERHGGKIWVESRLEQGSVFRFTLPHDSEERQDVQEQLNTARI